MFIRPVVLSVLVTTFIGAFALNAQRPGGGPGAPAELDTFKGVTADGAVVPNLFTVRETGVSTKPVVDAAARFISVLTPDQRKTTTFAADADEWRRWNNVHRAARAGLAFKDMTEEQQ